MTAPALTPRRSPLPPERERFWHLVHAEWTKFRTVRGWVIAVLITTIATSTAITQPGTVRNLVHSACTRYQKLSRSGAAGERRGVTVSVVMTTPPPGTRRCRWSVPYRPVRGWPGGR